MLEKINSYESNKNNLEISPKILLDKRELYSRKGYRFFKRIIDIIGSLFGLFLFSPLLAYIAIRIKLEEPKGSILFSQNRVGKNGKVFKMYKFRSMCLDAESKLEELLKHNEVDGAMFKMKDDPRITKIGKSIRKNSIDELPQFWNVLKGDMSLVGPRPPLIREVKEYTQYDQQRLLVKPGCTGIWQISGRNHVSFSEMVEMDIDYIRRSSIILDLKIIMKTVLVIIKPNGAY
ncbi:sugar transferase [Enterococcus casseliflavus]|nr:sugar transferase [Enterococcus casseliflavus]